MNLVIVSGSLREASFNTRLAQLLVAQAPAEVTAEVATLHGIPLYDGDLEEREGIPTAVEKLRTSIKQASGLVLVTPEYNAGMPGVLKNALDWLTRPGAELKPTFGGRKTALAGATPGQWGTAFAQAGALISLRQLGCNLYPGYLRVSRAGDLLGAEDVPDSTLNEQVSNWMAGFAEFVAGDG